jgi:hypothetical protein
MSKPPLPPEAQELLCRPTLVSWPRCAPTAPPSPPPPGTSGGRPGTDQPGRGAGPPAESALTVLADDDWYTHVTLIGRVVETHDDEGLADIDRISRHYTGKPYPDRVRARVSAWIEVERRRGWGAMKDSDQAST